MIGCDLLLGVLGKECMLYMGLCPNWSRISLKIIMRKLSVYIGTETQ